MDKLDKEYILGNILQYNNKPPNKLLPTQSHIYMPLITMSYYVRVLGVNGIKNLDKKIQEKLFMELRVVYCILADDINILCNLIHAISRHLNDEYREKEYVERAYKNGNNYAFNVHLQNETQENILRETIICGNDIIDFIKSIIGKGVDDESIKMILENTEKCDVKTIMDTYIEVYYY
jgi:hypothetical protein